MTRLVFMLEEPSMKALLEILLPRLFPGLNMLCIAHEGKSDLEKSIPRKLKNWKVPGDRFVVVRDADGTNCKVLKGALAALCQEAGRPCTLVRIVCQELEAWYFGQPEGLAAAFGDASLRTRGSRAKFRNPDTIVQPAKQLSGLFPEFQKVSGARRMAGHLSYSRNVSASFKAFIEGVARVSGRPLPNEGRG
jgi:hypothetical protein